MPASVRSLISFGDVAAEDDAILEYFLTTDAVPKIQDGAAFLVLGRKGSGKTALVRHFSEGTTKKTSKSLSLKGYPWRVHALRKDEGASEVEVYVASWRFLIAIELAQLAVSIADDYHHTDVKAIQRFLTENYGVNAVSLDAVLRPKELKLSRASFEPTILGNKLFSIQLERPSSDIEFGQELNALTETICASVARLIKDFKMTNLLLHFDELDQGLSTLDESRAKMLIGLVLAVRMTRYFFRHLENVIKPVIYLRTDIWDELEFSDKNKITQTNTLQLEWSSESLLKMVNERLRAKLNANIQWNDISNGELMRGGQSKWNHILARTFLRPRDVISFLNSALAIAKKRPDEPLVFLNPDVVAARDGYSSYLKKELDDEILPHWQEWEEALQACSAIATITFTRRQFEQEYSSRRSEANTKTAGEALKLLFNFSVIGYERRSGYGGTSWVFQYSEPSSGWDNTAAKFKVHLGLKEYAKLKEERA